MASADQSGLLGPTHGILGELEYEGPVATSDLRLNGRCRIGRFTYFNYGCEISDTDFGRYCSVGQRSIVNPGEHPTDWLSTHPFVGDPSGISCGMASVPAYAAIAGATLGAPRATRRVTIGHDVWLGANAVVLSGVSIGDGAVIAAGAVVSHDVAPFAVVGGVPARVIRYRFPEDMISRLRQLRWWDYDLAAVREEIDYSDLERAVSMLEALKARSELKLVQDRFVRFQHDGRMRQNVIEQGTRRADVAWVGFDNAKALVTQVADKLRAALQRSLARTRSRG
jgi:acetyltransferase-like isoleucine patch superfamily enzyme